MGILKGGFNSYIEKVLTPEEGEEVVIISQIPKTIQRLFLYFIPSISHQEIDKDNVNIDTLYYEFHEILEYFRSNKEENTEDLFQKYKIDMEEMKKNPIRITKTLKNSKNIFVIQPWYKNYGHNKVKDTFFFTFNPDILCILLKLKNNKLPLFEIPSLQLKLITNDSP